MPYSGITDATVNAKIDRCVQAVVKQGHDKSTAVAICRAAIPGAMTRKAEADAPNYHDAGPANLNICETCRFSRGDRQCTKYDFRYRNGWTCDAWRPNVEATRKRHQELSKMDTTKAQTLKREIPNRGDLTGGNFLYPDLRSFPIVKPEDVRAAASAWGRASKVRAAGHTFEDFKKRLTAKAKAKGPAFVAMLPKGWTEGEKSFTVFKDTQGQYRWIMRSSSAFEDKDRETVSTKALQGAVERGDQSGERGVLRFWHIPGADLGTCDFQMLHGRMLVESGTFKSDAIAERVASKAHLFGGSIGFNHPTTEPDTGGVFHNIRIFERSLVPMARASNRFTSLTVRSKEMNAEKEMALKTLLGDDLAAKVLAEAAATQKAAEEGGFSYKSNDELAEMTAEELLTYAQARKEFEDNYEVEAEEIEAEEAEEAPLTAKEFKAAMGEFAATFATAIKEALTGQPQTVDRKKEIDAAAGQIEATKKQVSELATQLKAAQAQLAELTGDQPKALKAGYRASQQAPAIEAEAEAAKAAKEMAAKSDPWGLGHIQQTLGVGWPGANNGQ